MKKTLTLLALIAALLLAACAPTATMTDDDAMADDAMMESTDSTTDGDEMMDDDAMDGDAMDGNDEVMDDESMADDEEMADDHAMDGDGEMMDDDAMTDDDAMAGDDEMMDDESMAGDEEMADDHAMDGDEEMMDDESMTGDDAMDDGEESMDEAMGEMELPAWQTLPVVDARTGESFTLADFAGKTVFVEPMATWCTNCKRQLNNVRAAKAETGEDVVFVALSVETNITADDLAAYADGEEFDWTFAVMTPDLLREMAAAFGQTISNPPSTPHFIIRPDGSTTDLTTGIESSAEILEQIAAAQG